VFNSTESSAILRNPEFRALLGERLSNALATTALVTVIGYQVYEVTKDPLALGLLGLVEAIPALGLALFGGHVADRSDRRTILLITSAASVLCALGLAFVSATPALMSLAAVLTIIFIAGIASGFFRPALSAFEAQVIPIEHAARGQSWMSSVWLTGGIVGPAMGGFAYALLGVTNTYLLIAALFVVSVFCLFLISRKPKPVPEEGESIWQSISQGAKYVLKNQYLVGSMALDLFAVLFGGAMAMLPIFASDILKVGPAGLGFLRTAPTLGALLVTMLATRRPPTSRAGRNLLFCVAGFGLSMIVFALSQNFWLSLLALFFSGLTDGVSMIIRGLIVRVMSPENMRGRIASVSWIFIGASNEIGAFESGIAAKVLGVAASVFWGGVVTLLVVGAVAALAPKLRRLNLDQHQMQQIEEDVARAALATGDVQPGDIQPGGVTSGAMGS
jgi:MFS family permease